ncbi:MAG: hypothetical protein ACYDBJ_17970 [Aggregatilineales bacterium]
MSDQQETDQHIIRAVRVGGEWFVTHLDDARLDGKVDDRSLPLLERYVAFAAEEGYQPVSLELDHFTEREAQLGVPFIFRHRQTPTELADRVLSLAQPVKPTPPPIPVGHVADPRFRRGYRPAEQSQSALKPTPSIALPADDASQKLMANLRNRF